MAQVTAASDEQRLFAYCPELCVLLLERLKEDGKTVCFFLP